MPCEEAEETVPPSDGETESSDDEITRRINLARRRRSYQELRSLALSSSSAPSSGLSMPERRARGTQTARRIQFSIATQTDDVGTNSSSAQSSTADAGEGTSSGSAGQTGNASQARTLIRVPSTSRDSSTQIIGNPISIESAGIVSANTSSTTNTSASMSSTSSSSTSMSSTTSTSSTTHEPSEESLSQQSSHSDDSAI